MNKNPGLFNKKIVIGIIVIFIGSSAVSSTGKIAEDNSFNNSFLDYVNNPKDLLSCDHSAYIIGDGPDCYLYEFILNNASDLNCVCEGSSGYISHVTWSSDNYIYFTQYASGFLYVIDIESCEMSFIGGGGYSLNGGLAYDLTTNRMYGVTNSGIDDYLVEVDPVTGEQELIGQLGGSILYTVGLAFDSEGTLYGWDAGNDKLWKIDKETGEVIIVGDLGFNINYACDGDFCKEDDILYIAYENKLYMYYLDKGQCELIDEFPDYVSVTGLAIPYEDTTPPKTTHTLNPPEPDGLNGWYVSDVNVTLTATDDISGVKEIRYIINGGADGVIPGDNGSFILSEDGDDILVEFWAIDYAGNAEPKNDFSINIDKTEPEIDLIYEIVGGNRWQGWDFLFTATAVDDISGMERVEFYLNDKLQETINGPGPYYECEIKIYPSDFDFYSFFVRGLICNLEITEELVNFYSFITFIRIKDWEGSPYIFACGYDLAGNYDIDEILNPCYPTSISPGFYIFQNLTLPNTYTGHIGRFFISATFDMS